MMAAAQLASDPPAVSYRVEIRSKVFGRWILWREFPDIEQANQARDKIAPCYPAGAVRVRVIVREGERSAPR